MLIPLTMRHARQRADLLQELELEAPDRIVAVGDERRHADAEGQHRLARQAEILRLQAQQALHHQAGSGDERQGQRHFATPRADGSLLGRVPAVTLRLLPDRITLLRSERSR